MSVSIRVIPCLDVADGRVVKGVNFQNLKDAGDPVELASLYYQDGADELTFLDVNATNENRDTMYDLVTATAEQVFIPLTVGGGVRTVDDVARLLGAGADKVSVSSAAIARPQLIGEISQRYGAQVLVLSLDAKRGESPSGFVVTTNGGRQTTDKDALEWLQNCIELGVGEVLINSIDADGMQSGFDEEMIAAARSVCSVPLVASGGAGKPSDFVGAARSGADAVLAASIFHNRSVTIRDVKATLASAGFETR